MEHSRERGETAYKATAFRTEVEGRGFSIALKKLEALGVGRGSTRSYRQFLLFAINFSDIVP
jgi:hypothetical protein